MSFVRASSALVSAALALVFFGCGTTPRGDDPPPEPPTMQHVSELRAEVDREAPDASDEALRSLVADHTSFAVWLYGRGVEANGAEENILLSPLSVSTAFGMLWPGAVGETAQEIARMLHFELEPVAFHRASNRLDRELAARNEYRPRGSEGDAPVLEIVNDVWGLDEYPYVEAYLELLARNYGAGMWIVDFANAAEAARREINEYIAFRTRGLVEELLPPGSIDGLTRLVLTNAIYFKAGWMEPFREQVTAEGPFTTIDGDVLEVHMMAAQLEEAAHAEVDGASAVEISYVGGELAMLLILPDEGTFEDYEAKLDRDSLSRLIDALEPGGGRLAMPRFEFEAELDLVDIFESEGYSVPFAPGIADFSGLSHVALEEELHVTGAFHKAAIAVDEKGTEAAAATAVVVGRESAPAQMFDIRLDRPFIFLIRDRGTGAVLFMGRMVAP